MELLGHLFVDPASMANRNNPDDPACLINGVDNTKPPHPVFPQPLQFPKKRLTRVWVHTERSQGLLDAAF